MSISTKKNLILAAALAACGLANAASNMAPNDLPRYHVIDVPANAVEFPLCGTPKRIAIAIPTSDCKSEVDKAVRELVGPGAGNSAETTPVSAALASAKAIISKAIAAGGCFTEPVWMTATGGQRTTQPLMYLAEKPASKGAASNFLKARIKVVIPANTSQAGLVEMLVSQNGRAPLSYGPFLIGGSVEVGPESHTVLSFDR